MLLSLIHWKPPGTLPKSAFPLQKQREGSVCVKNCLWRLWKFSTDMSRADTAHQRNYFVWLHRDTEAHWRKHPERKRRAGADWKLVTTLTLSLSFSCVFISALCVWFVVLLVTASVSRSFSSCYLLCLSFSSSCLPLYPRLSLSVSSPSLSLSFSTDCPRIHSSTLACSLMAVAGVFPGAWAERPGLSL